MRLLFLLFLASASCYADLWTPPLAEFVLVNPVCATKHALPTKLLGEGETLLAVPDASSREERCIAGTAFGYIEEGIFVLHGISEWTRNDLRYRGLYSHNRPVGVHNLWRNDVTYRQWYCVDGAVSVRYYSDGKPINGSFSTETMSGTCIDGFPHGEVTVYPKPVTYDFDFSGETFSLKKIVYDYGVAKYNSIEYSDDDSYKYYGPGGLYKRVVSGQLTNVGLHDDGEVVLVVSYRSLKSAEM